MSETRLALIIVGGAVALAIILAGTVVVTADSAISCAYACRGRMSSYAEQPRYTKEQSPTCVCAEVKP